MGDFDAAGLYELDGATSAVAWLRSFGRLSGARAANVVRTSRRLRKLSVVAEAFASAQLSAGQVQAIVANLADQAMVDLFAEHEAEVVPALVGLSVADTARVMQEWRVRAEAVLPRPEPDDSERSLHISKTLDGRRQIAASFDAEGGQILDTALRLATSDDVDGEPPRSPARRRADAFIDIARAFLDHLHRTPAGRNRPHLNIVVDTESADPADGEMLARFFDGEPIGGAALQRLLCDAALHRVLMKARSEVLDYGRATATISASLWAALGIRDEHCRFPGCDRPLYWCEGHHVIAWEHGGPTALANLVVLCSRHHHLVHRRGWSLRLKRNAEVEVTTADGRILRSEVRPTTQMTMPLVS